jgi:hypothetical protein
MAARDIAPVPGAQFEQILASANPDLLREMIRGFTQKMMDAFSQTVQVTAVIATRRSYAAFEHMLA